VTHPVEEPVSAIILAGGQSRRMGKNKALLPVHGQPLILWIAQRLKPLTQDIIVVARSEEPYTSLGLSVTLDRWAGIGPLAGLHAGLMAAANPWAFVLACDMPLVSPKLLRFLLELREEDTDVVMPCVGGREEPLHALYRKETCLPAVEEVIARDQRRLISFLPHVRVRYVEETTLRTVDPELLSFLNVNTAEEWERIQSLLS